MECFTSKMTGKTGKMQSWTPQAVTGMLIPLHSTASGDTCDLAGARLYSLIVRHVSMDMQAMGTHGRRVSVTFVCCCHIDPLTHAFAAGLTGRGHLRMLKCCRLLVPEAMLQ